MSISWNEIVEVYRSQPWWVWLLGLALIWIGLKWLKRTAIAYVERPIKTRTSFTQRRVRVDYRAGTITMPIRVAVVEGDKVLYSKLHEQTVQVSQTGATQFIFTDPGVNLPRPSGPNYLVFVGYDEGPYNTQ